MVTAAPLCIDTWIQVLLSAGGICSPCPSCRRPLQNILLNQNTKVKVVSSSREGQSGELTALLPLFCIRGRSPQGVSGGPVDGSVWIGPVWLGPGV